MKTEERKPKEYYAQYLLNVEIKTAIWKIARARGCPLFVQMAVAMFMP